MLYMEEKMSNPVLNLEKEPVEQVVNANDAMTINGTINIMAFMGILLVLSAAFVWSRFMLGYTDIAMTLTAGGGIVAFIISFIIIFTKNKNLVPVYAVAEGLALGGISAIFEQSYPGIVSQAVAGTFAAFFSMLILYRTGIIKCSDRFRSVIFVATLSILVVYLINLIGSFFGYSVPHINTSSNFGIIFSLIVVVIASLNLIIDFDFVERGTEMMLPKKYEWYAAFGLMVTLVWIYIEVLKLLAKFSERK